VKLDDGFFKKANHLLLHILPSPPPPHFSFIPNMCDSLKSFINEVCM